MVWFVACTRGTGRRPMDSIVDAWAAVGVRAIARERRRSSWNLDVRSLLRDFTIWSGESDFAPIISPRHSVGS